MTELPESGSEWYYHGKRIVVDGVYVGWHYLDSKDGQTNRNAYSAAVEFWGGSFKPVPYEPKAGDRYVRMTNDGAHRERWFVVGEVFGERAYGRQTENSNGFDADPTVWYADDWGVLHLSKYWERVSD